MSDNWVVQNLVVALGVWNQKLTEIWSLITASPHDFKGGDIWNVIVAIRSLFCVSGSAVGKWWSARGRSSLRGKAYRLSFFG